MNKRWESVSLIDGGGDLKSFQALKDEIIEYALVICRGNASQAAARLGLGRSTVYRYTVRARDKRRARMGARHVVFSSSGAVEEG